MTTPLEAAFPLLTGTAWRVTSVATNSYNCIAWAAGDTRQKWWPHPDAFWPANITEADTISAFVEAFQSLGYSRCDNGALEAEYEKVAVYAAFDGAPRHAARQLPSGMWSSKLGDDVDIEHETPAALNGNMYGAVVLYMRRRLAGVGLSIAR